MSMAGRPLCTPTMPTCTLTHPETEGRHRSERGTWPLRRQPGLPPRRLPRPPRPPRYLCCLHSCPRSQPSAAMLGQELSGEAPWSHLQTPQHWPQGTSCEGINSQKGMAGPQTAPGEQVRASLGLGYAKTPGASPVSHNGQAVGTRAPALVSRAERFLSPSQTLPAPELLTQGGQHDTLLPTTNSGGLLSPLRPRLRATLVHAALRNTAEH